MTWLIGLGDDLLDSAVYGGGGAGGPGGSSGPNSGGQGSVGRRGRRDHELDDDNPIQEMSLYEGQSLNNPSKFCLPGLIVFRTIYFRLTASSITLVNKDLDHFRVGLEKIFFCLVHSPLSKGVS